MSNTRGQKRKKLDNPTERQTGTEDPYAYTITDKYFPDFKVLNSANGWWLDKVKVMNLISAYKIDCTDAEACTYAGITPENLRYFKELHPEFSHIKDVCKELPNISARQTAVQKIPESYSNAMDYLKRKKKDEFGDNQQVDLGVNEDMKEFLLKLNLDKIYGGNKPSNE